MSLLLSTLPSFSTYHINPTEDEEGGGYVDYGKSFVIEIHGENGGDDGLDVNVDADDFGADFFEGEDIEEVGEEGAADDYEGDAEPCVGVESVPLDFG